MKLSQILEARYEGDERDKLYSFWTHFSLGHDGNPDADVHFPLVDEIGYSGENGWVNNELYINHIKYDWDFQLGPDDYESYEEYKEDRQTTPWIASIHAHGTEKGFKEFLRRLKREYNFGAREDIDSFSKHPLSQYEAERLNDVWGERMGREITGPTW